MKYVFKISPDPGTPQTQVLHWLDRIVEPMKETPNVPNIMVAMGWGVWVTDGSQPIPARNEELIPYDGELPIGERFIEAEVEV